MLIIPPSNEVGGVWGEGVWVYWIHLVRLSVCPSVCRRHGFRSITQVCFGISISMLYAYWLWLWTGAYWFSAMSITLNMAAWLSSWILWFPDSNFNLTLNIKFKLQWHIKCVYRKEPIKFQLCHFPIWPPGGHFGFFGFRTLISSWLWVSNPNICNTLPACIGR